MWNGICDICFDYRNQNSYANMSLRRTSSVVAFTVAEDKMRLTSDVDDA